MEFSRPVIVMIGGEKGGTGKSTTAAEVALRFRADGHDTLLVNTDSQGTLPIWSGIRSKTLKDLPQFTCVNIYGENVADELRDLRRRYQVLVVDTGGRDTVEFRAGLSVADLLVIPSAPSGPDMWTLPKMNELLNLVRPYNPNLVTLLVPSKLGSTGLNSGRSRMAEALDKYPLIRMTMTTVIHRTAFQDAYTSGRGVAEMKRRDPKAVSEMNGLYLDIVHALRKRAEKQLEAAHG